jgi:hypothetical protein
MVVDSGPFVLTCEGFTRTRKRRVDHSFLPPARLLLCDNAGMLVHGSIRPPRAVVEALDEVVRSVPEPHEETEQASGKGLFRRLGRHRADSDEPAEPAPAMLEHPALDRVTMPITGFGNLTLNDAHRLAASIGAAAADWQAPRLRFAGGTALDFPGDWSVWAKLDGDVEAVLAAARGVTQSVEALGFFVDRRQFRPMMSVATVTPATTGPYLEAVVAALDSFEGQEWVATVSLTKETFIGGRPEMTEFLQIPIGTASE